MLTPIISGEFVPSIVTQPSWVRLPASYSYSGTCFSNRGMPLNTAESVI